MKKILVLAVILLVSIVFLAGCKKKSSGVSQISLTYYKLYDDEDVIRPAIEAYQAAHPNVRIRYRKFVDPEVYEDLILNELAEGEGPDIFEVSNLSLPRYFKKIKPLVSKSYTSAVYQDTYVSVAADDFLKVDPADKQEKIYGIPLSIDTPVLYYNKTLYEGKFPEKGKPGALWEDIVDEAFLLREEEVAEEGRSSGVSRAVSTLSPGSSSVASENSGPHLIRGGIALGRSDNIKYAVDIVLNFMLQRGVSFYDADGKRLSLATREGEEALDFFVNFADSKRKQFSWDEGMVSADSSLKEVEAFLSGKVATIVGYSDLFPQLEVHLRNLKAKGLNTVSKGNIGIAPLPQQTEDLNAKAVLAHYAAQTVSRTSKNAFAAWDFVAFLTSKDQAKRYLEKTQKPAARRDLLENQKQDPQLSVFVSQLGFAKSIPFIHEGKFREWFTDGIQKVLLGEASSGKVLQDIQNQLNAM